MNFKFITKNISSPLRSPKILSASFARSSSNEIVCRALVQPPCLNMDPLSQPAAYQTPETDIEERGELEDSIKVSTSGSKSTENPTSAPTLVLLKSKLAKLNAKIESLAGLEARGITRVLPEEKHDIKPMGCLQMFSLWFSMNLVVENIVVAFLGPLVFSLGWKDCVFIVIFANALSSCGAAYMGTFGAQSGNRTMVCHSQSPEYAASIPFKRQSLFKQVAYSASITYDRSLADTLWVIGHLN